MLCKSSAHIQQLYLVQFVKLLHRCTHYYINVREIKKGNQEQTTQRHWQHWAHKTHDETKQ